MPLLMPGQEVGWNEPGRVFARHHHLTGYAAVVLRGSCGEHGDRGRFVAREGDVLAHDAFDGHADRIGPGGATIINIPLLGPTAVAFGRVTDLDCVVRAFERSPGDAAHALAEQLKPVAAAEADWPDELADCLARPAGSVRLGPWAAAQGLHPASVSRGFRLAYGMSPQRYRLEQMAARAARQIARSRKTFAAIAADCGFADQSHMTRIISSLFRVSPAALRAMLTRG